MHKQQSSYEVKLQVKLEESISTLPSRSSFYSTQQTSYKMLTNVIRVKFNQNKDPVIHMYRIEIKPNVHENCKDSNIIEYINIRLTERLKKFVYVKQEIIVATEQFTKSQKLIKLVYNNTPIEVWLYHKKSYYFGKPFDNLSYWNGNNYLKSILAHDLSHKNYTNCNKKSILYAPKAINISETPYLALETFFTSFLWCDRQMFFTAKSQAKLIERITILQEINMFYKDNQELNKVQKHTKLNEIYKGRQIISNYGKMNIYTIYQIEFNTKVNEISVETIDKEGKTKKITLVEYYRIKYQLQVTNLNQPLIKTKSATHVYLLPEFTSFVTAKKQIEREKLKMIEEMTALNLQENIKHRKDFITNLTLSGTQSRLDKLCQIGINLDKDFVTINAFALDYPIIQTGTKKKIDIFRGRQFDFQDMKIYSNKNKLNVCLIYPNSLNHSIIRNDVNASTENSGIICNLTFLPYILKSPKETLNYIKQIIYVQKGTQKKNKTNIFWIIIPNQFSNLYSHFKNLTYNCNIQTISQITLTSTFQLPDSKKIINGIVEQMAAKINNPLWNVVNQTQHQIILIGIHDNNQNYITSCSNTNLLISKFYSGFYEYDPEKSLSMHIRKIVETSMNKYIQMSQSVPNQIVILRFQNKNNVQQESAECRQIKNALLSYKDIDFGINYYAVSYSYNLQVCLQKDKYLSRPFQGMLINKDIVSEGDFYILNDEGREKQTKIVHYKRIFSQSLFRGLPFQQFIYDQTFNYFNFKGSVFIPGVLKYASKLSKTLNAYKCNNGAFKNLSNNLYFL